MKQPNHQPGLNESIAPISKKSCATCQEILKYVISYKEERDGNSPSHRRIAEGVGISLATVTSHIGHLRKDGLVKPGNKQQPIELTFGQWMEDDVGSPAIVANAEILCSRCRSLVRLDGYEYVLQGQCKFCGLEIHGRLLTDDYPDGLSTPHLRDG